jgi:CheY-like chemotaxis protein
MSEINVTDPLIVNLRNLKGPPKVLLIEDSPFDAELIKRELERAGCLVIVAQDGPEALATLEKVIPNIIFLDMGLPGMDGPELWVEIRRRHACIPIIVITNPINLEMVKRIPAGGLLAVTEKPLTMETVLGIFGMHRIPLPGRAST